MRMPKLVFSGTAFVCLAVLSGGAQGADLKVHCGGSGALSTINGALKLLKPEGPNTLTISGTCTENVLIQRFNRLTLKGNAGATISDGSGGSAVVVDISDSTDVVLQGLTINGGANGVTCGNFSVCRLTGDVIQKAIGVGLFAYQSRVSVESSSIWDNLHGLVSLESSSVRSFGGLEIQSNLGTGVIVDTNGSFASFNDTIRNNGGDGIGITYGRVLLLGTTITENAAYGVTVTGHSTADFEGTNVITANGFGGVLVKDSSFADFRTPNTVTGNGSGLDVECQPQFPATRGALTNIEGGVTNCVEP